MKTLILTAALFIAMTAANATTVNDTVMYPVPVDIVSHATIVQPNDHMINFRISNPESDKIVMKIYNEKNVKVFHRRTKRNINLSIKCDMQNCTTGKYTAVVERNGLQELREEFIIEN